MTDVRVKCINKANRLSSHESITHLGGESWRWTSQQVISSIEDKTNSFYTMENNKRADIGVVNGPNGKYLRTHADGRWTDNLLALPECIS